MEKKNLLRPVDKEEKQIIAGKWQNEPEKIHQEKGVIKESVFQIPLADIYVLITIISFLVIHL